MKYKLLLILVLFSINTYAMPFIRYSIPADVSTQHIRYSIPYQIQNYSDTPTPPSTTFNTPLGSATNWTWASSDGAGLVRSGSPTNWTWRAYSASSGRKIPNGTATNWSWVNE